MSKEENNKTTNNKSVQKENEDVRQREGNSIGVTIQTIVILIILLIAGIFGCSVAVKNSMKNVEQNIRDEYYSFMFDLDVLVNDEELSDAEKIAQLKEFVDNYNASEDTVIPSQE